MYQIIIFLPCHDHFVTQPRNCNNQQRIDYFPINQIIMTPQFCRSVCFLSISLSKSMNRVCHVNKGKVWEWFLMYLVQDIFTKHFKRAMMLWGFSTQEPGYYNLSFLVKMSKIADGWEKMLLLSSSLKWKNINMCLTQVWNTIF